MRDDGLGVFLWFGWTGKGWMGLMGVMRETLLRREFDCDFMDVVWCTVCGNVEMWEMDLSCVEV